MAQDDKNDKKMTASDHDVIRELAQLLEETDLTEIEIERQGLRVRVARQSHTSSFLPAVPAAPTSDAAKPAGEPESDLANHAGAVTSPMVGTAYLAPKPGDPPFVLEGDIVTQGQTLMIIEAMKTMNPIPAPTAGKVMRVLVPDGHPVEYGELLLVIE